MLSGPVSCTQLLDGSMVFAISLGKVVRVLRLTKWRKGKAFSMVRLWSGVKNLHLVQDLTAGVILQPKLASEIPFAKWQKCLAGPDSGEFSNY